MAPYYQYLSFLARPILLHEAGARQRLDRGKGRGELLLNPPAFLYERDSSPVKVMQL
jgi:hypothetical protein